MSVKKPDKPVLVPFKKSEPKSSMAYIELLRGFIDAAYDGKMTFLEISAIIDGEIRTVSITSTIK